ncbi:MAG: hypothetical protein AAFY71_13370 [Bacteroidota bacterium]
MRYAGLMVLSVLMMGLNPLLAGQTIDCSTNEAEMVNYFTSYSPKSSKFLNIIERYWKSCEEPTPQMDLMYFYARSSFYMRLYRQNRNKRQAFDNSKEGFYIASNNFMLLKSYQGEGDEFWDKLNELYVELEDQLVHYDPYKKYRSRKFRRKLDKEVASGNWIKNDWLLDIQNEGTRAQEGPQKPAFLKKYYYDGRYVSRFPSDSAGIDSLGFDEVEEYGFVGEMEGISLMEFLRWLGEKGKTGSREIYYDASVWMESLNDEYDVLICGMDSISMLDIPNQSGRPLVSIGFGEGVARIPEQPAVYQDDITFVKVRVETGEQGWVPLITMIPDGALAVITQNTVAKKNLHSRFDRGQFLIPEGTMVILSQEKDDDIQIVTRNLGSIGWISAESGWSILYDDVVIGIMYYEAQQLPYLLERQSELKAITEFPGFDRSPLSELILYELSQLER